jgi:hypothetical protein
LGSHPIEQSNNYLIARSAGAIAAGVSFVILITALRAPKKRVVYSAILLALFLFLVAISFIGAHVSFLPEVHRQLMILAVRTVSASGGTRR